MGVGHVVVSHLVREHGGCQVCVFGEASDLESPLQETHDVGMYGKALCGCDVMWSICVCLLELSADQNEVGRGLCCQRRRGFEDEREDYRALHCARGRAVHGI